jgi:hypothetical protein
MTLSPFPSTHPTPHPTPPLPLPLPQVIVKEGLPLSSAYFINRGLVQILVNDVPQGQLTNNDNFGLDDYTASWERGFKGQAATVSRSAQSITYCDVMGLQVEFMNEVSAERGAEDSAGIYSASATPHTRKPGCLPPSCACSTPCTCRNPSPLSHIRTICVHSYTRASLVVCLRARRPPLCGRTGAVP